jgi:hypothetical protein
MPLTKEIFSVTNYAYNIDLTESHDGEIGNFSLWNADTLVADFRIKIQGVDLNNFTFGADRVVRGDISALKRDAIIDLLRHEAPIRMLAWYDEDSEVGTVSLVRLGTSTSELEPVGEGDRDSNFAG